MKQILDFNDFITICSRNERYIFSTPMPLLEYFYRVFLEKKLWNLSDGQNILIAVEKYNWFDLYFKICKNTLINNLNLDKHLYVVNLFGNKHSIDCINTECINFLKINKFYLFDTWNYYINMTLNNMYIKSDDEKIIIDYASHEDLLPVYELLNNLYFIGREIPSKKELINQILNKEVFIAKDIVNKKVVGAKIVKYQGKTAVDHGIVIDKNYRGMRIGTKLLNNSYDLIKNNGCIRTDAWISPTNIASINLHLSSGYKKTNRSLFKFISKY